LDSPSTKQSEIARSAEETWGHRARGVTLRVVVIALLVAPLNAYFLAQLQGPRSIEGPTVVSLYYNVVFLLFLLRLANGILNKWAPRYAFSPAEQLAFFIMLAVCTCGGGLDTMKTTFATIQGAHRFATPENHWEDLFLSYVPESMTVSDEAALDRLWLGDSSIFDPRNYRVWIGPVIRWWLFYTALWAGPAGLAVLFRRRWLDREKMGFPIVQLPYELSRPRVPVTRHPMFWIGVGLAVFVNTLNGLHALVPTVPLIPVKLNSSETINLQRFFVGRPWNAIGRFQLCSYPFIVGLGLLLPTELSFSLWFFHLFWKSEAIACSWLGLNQTPEFPYMKEQSFGGYLALLAFALVAARPYFVRVWRRIVGLAGGAVDEGEPLRYRTAFLVFLAGFVYVVGVGMAQKMALLVAVGFFVQYYIMTLIIGRIRAEMGMPTHEIERLGPTVMQGNILGLNVLGIQNMTSLSLFFSFTRGMRNIPFPHQFEGLFLQGRVGGDQRRMLLASMAMVPVGVGLSFFFVLFLGYRHGLGMDWARWMPWSCQEAWRQLQRWVMHPTPIQFGRLYAVVIGFVVYYGIMIIRTRALWWPLHPMGFALSTTWYMSHMWFPMFEAWLMRTLAQHYSGLSGTRALMPLAFGLILGDIVTGCLWVLYAIATGTHTYSFWP